MSIGTFTLIRNESPWIAAHLLRILPYIDECVFFDGNSTDGTIEIIEAIKEEHDAYNKIHLVKNKDVKNLQDDYVRLFDECMRSLHTDLAWFLHPDMHILDPAQLLLVKNSPAIALTTSMRSYAGEIDGDLFEIKGRGEMWKNIYRLRNPDLGAHYYGTYGHADEDVYFSAITGNKHEHYGQDFKQYPYAVQHSGIEVMHFSDVRPLQRRVGRMISCLMNNGFSEEAARERALRHPRVTLKDGDGFSFIPARYPGEFLAAKAQYQHLIKEPEQCQAA